MRTRVSLIISVAAAAAGVVAGAVGTASASPASSVPGITSTDDPGVNYVNIVNTGKVTRVRTNNLTVTLTDTALNRSWCNTAVFDGTAAELIAKEPIASTVRPVDIPGPDVFISVDPSVADLVGFPVSAEQTSPVTVSATLPAGKYTAFSYCYTFDTAGNEVPNNNYYFDEFTLPSASPVRFGSS